LFIGTPHGSRIKQLNILLSNKIPVTIYSDKVSGYNFSNIRKALFPLDEILQHLTFKSGRKILLGKILSMFYNDKLLKNEYLEIFPSVKASEMACLYRKYRLSWSSVYARNTGYLKSPLITINVRSFEIPISGGLQFVAHNSELKKYFSDGHDIVFYDSENFVDTARHYLFELSENKIIEMKNSAMKNSLDNHTWGNRFNKIFDILRLKL
jgi:spore maturation protein CgeB